MAQEIVGIIGERPVSAAALKAGRPLPLAIGIGPQLEAVAREHGASDDAVLALHIALGRYCSSFEYLSAVAADGATRHNIDGSVADSVSTEHQDHAIRNLVLRDKRKREAAERAAYERGVADGRAAARAEVGEEQKPAAAPEAPASAAPAKAQAPSQPAPVKRASPGPGKAAKAEAVRPPVQSLLSLPPPSAHRAPTALPANECRARSGARGAEHMRGRTDHAARERSPGPRAAAGFA